MSTSTVSVFGAARPLREGHVEAHPDVPYRWFVGGQAQRSFQVAWWLIENALDADPSLAVRRFWGTPIARCASMRFGNCLSVELERREPWPMWCASAFEPERPCAVIRGRAPVWGLYDLATGRRLPTPVFGLLGYHDARGRLQFEAERQGYYLSSWSDGDDREDS